MDGTDHHALLRGLACGVAGALAAVAVLAGAVAATVFAVAFALGAPLWALGMRLTRPAKASLHRRRIARAPRLSTRSSTA
jgi:Flp pilus assembly protein TadB